MIDSALAALSFCYVTTTGRVTGKPHRIEIWFAAAPEADTIYILSGGRERSDWVRNLVASPSCTVELGADTSRATAASSKAWPRTQRRAISCSRSTDAPTISNRGAPKHSRSQST